MTNLPDVDGRFAQGWGGEKPNGCHVNVILARRGSPTAAAMVHAFTAPSEGFTPILVSLGPDQPSYEAVNPPTIMLNKSPLGSERAGALVSGACQVGIGQGVLDGVAADLLEPDQETLVFVSVWLDPDAENETDVKHSAREAVAKAVWEAVRGRREEDAQRMVDQRESLTHPFYSGR